MPNTYEIGQIRCPDADDPRRCSNVLTGQAFPSMICRPDTLTQGCRQRGTGPSRAFNGKAVARKGDEPNTYSLQFPQRMGASPPSKSLARSEYTAERKMAFRAWVNRGSKGSSHHQWRDHNFGSDGV